MAEHDMTPRNNNKWQVALPWSPHHPGDPIPGWHISEERSHSEGLRFFRQTNQLNQQTRHFVHSSLHLMLENKNLVRVPVEFIGSIQGDRPIQVLLTGDNVHTPDNITVIPEVVSVDPSHEVTISIL